MDRLYYHGSDKEIIIGSSLRTPTGRADGSITKGGAVYMTSTPEACQRYGRYIYIISCEKAIPYKEALRKIGRSKKGRLTRGVFVACPQDTKVIGILQKK